MVLFNWCVLEIKYEILKNNFKDIFYEFILEKDERSKPEKTKNQTVMI